MPRPKDHTPYGSLNHPSLKGYRCYARDLDVSSVALSGRVIGW